MEFIGGVAVCRGCAEVFRDCPELLPKPQAEPLELRTEATILPHDECIRKTQPRLVAFATPPKVFLSPILMLAHSMVRQSFHDARQCRFGCPTLEALAAYRWLTDSVHEANGDGLSFTWCVRWLSDDVETVRCEGLRDRHTRGRMGGIEQVHAIWRQAEADFQAKGGIAMAVQRELSRRQRERDRLLCRAFHGIVRQKQLGFISESHYLKGGSHNRKQVA